MNKLCPGCGVELQIFKVKIDDQFKEVYAHPETIKECLYKNDGLKVTVEIIDDFMMNKFQQLIEEEGIEKPLKIESPLNVAEAPALKCDVDVVKSRLASGDLSIQDYLEVKKLLELE